jgi:hypothetical protein
MFVRYYVELAMPIEEAERRLLDSPGDWVPGLAREAGARGDALLGEVGFGEGRLRVAKAVHIELRPPARLGSTAVLPLTWSPTGPGGLFPTLEADLEIAPLGPARSQLAISARYEPPLGIVGRAVDRALLHRVAEATIKDFLDHAAARLAA